MADERKTSAGSSEYKDCKRFFIRSINEIKAEIENTRNDITAAAEENRRIYREIGKKSSVLFGNNFFGFLMIAGLILLPFFVIAFLIKLAGAGTFVSLIPIIIALILIAVSTVLRLVKFKRSISECSKLREECANIKELLAQLNGDYKFAVKKRKKLKRLYKELKKNPSMDESEVEKLRKRFEKIYARKNVTAVEE